MIGRLIKLDMSKFDTAISDADLTSEDFTAEWLDVIQKHQELYEDPFWVNAGVGSFENTIAAMNRALDSCAMSYIYFSNVLKQVKLDFAHADQAGS